MLVTIIAVIVALAIAVPLSVFLTNSRRNDADRKKVQSAGDEARAIIDKAISDAENKKREALLEAKEMIWKRRFATEGQRFRATREDFSRRKRRSTRSRTDWNGRNSPCHQGKIHCARSRKKLRSLVNSVHRNSNEFQA